MTTTELIAAMREATDNVEGMSVEELRRVCNAACFLTAAITCERDRRERTVRIMGDYAAAGVIPAEGDFFALSTTCQACRQPAYWRLGSGTWEHANSAEGGL